MATAQAPAGELLAGGCTFTRAAHSACTLPPRVHAAAGAHIVARLRATAAGSAVRHDPSPDVLTVLRDADAVCFDVDSTL